MGGSLGMALVRRGGWRVTGVGRRADRLKAAKSRGALHAWTTDFREGARDADVVVLAVPVDGIVAWARKLRPFLKRDCLVMDVGSVKGSIVSALDAGFSKGPFFVGAHPMAGSEKTGAENARADLYKGAACVVTPGRRVPAAAVKRAGSFWRSIGAGVLRMAPAEHDRWVAMISHLPHLMAYSLALSAGRWGNARFARALAAGSFRDMTRVAGADPDQWSQIFSMNAKSLREALRLFQATAAGLTRKGWPAADLRRAKRLHDRFVR